MACPRDTDGDGNCGQRYCPDCAPPFALLVCDGCGIGAPPGSSTNEIRSLAQAHGWAVNMGPESQDFCSDCADKREIPVDP